VANQQLQDNALIYKRLQQVAFGKDVTSLKGKECSGQSSYSYYNSLSVDI